MLYFWIFFNLFALAMLVLLRNGKVPEDHEEEEEIVYTEGKFEHVTSNEFQSHLSPLPKENQSGKSRGEGDPHGAPRKGFARAYNAATAVEDKKIQHQHGEREQVEENPEIEQRGP